MRYGNSAAMKSLCIILFFCAPVFGTWLKLPDQTVETPVGNFKITELKCDHHAVGNFLVVNGRIVNETSKSWDTVSLAMEFRDKNGQVKPKASPDPIVLAFDPSASAGITAKNVGKGQTINLS